MNTPQKITRKDLTGIATEFLATENEMVYLVNFEIRNEIEDNVEANDYIMIIYSTVAKHIKSAIEFEDYETCSILNKANELLLSKYLAKVKKEKGIKLMAEINFKYN